VGLAVAADMNKGRSAKIFETRAIKGSMSIAKTGSHSRLGTQAFQEMISLFGRRLAQESRMI
jgi:hypothetical protein